MDLFRKFRIFEKSPLAKQLPWELVDIIGDYLYEPVEIEIYKSRHMQNILKSIVNEEESGALGISSNTWKEELMNIVNIKEPSKQWLHICSILEVWNQLGDSIFEINSVLFGYNFEVVDINTTFLVILDVIDQSQYLLDNFKSYKYIDLLGRLALSNLDSYRNSCEDIITEWKKEEYHELFDIYPHYVSLMQKYYPEKVNSGWEL